jgi:signal transduction histidine kinase
MTTRGRVHDAVHRHTMAVDALLACMVLTGIMLAASSKHDDRWVSGPQTPLVITIEALVFFSLVLRRTMPIPVLFVTVLGAVSVMLLIKGWSPVGVAVVIAVYTLSRRTDRRTALITAFGCGAALVIGGACRSGDWFSTESISLLAWTGFAAALGQAIQSQKAYVAAVEERALRAEQTREEEAARRVIEERLRIARELHDVVAHHIAVIQVQAGVVDHLLTERPDAAREALTHVRRSSKMVLDELGDMLDVLRQPDDPITPTDPAPGMERLTALIDQFAVSGLKVDWRVTGQPRNLPAAVDLVAYRLVQEGLTNAHKHGTGSAEMVIGFEPGGLMIDIVNQAGGPPCSSGHGLAGMRERVAIYGGKVQAHPVPSGFEVVAELPFRGDR